MYDGGGSDSKRGTERNFHETRHNGNQRKVMDRVRDAVGQLAAECGVHFR
jgi:hypothetical protein